MKVEYYNTCTELIEARYAIDKSSIVALLYTIHTGDAMHGWSDGEVLAFATVHIAFNKSDINICSVDFNVVIRPLTRSYSLSRSIQRP